MRLQKSARISWQLRAVLVGFCRALATTLPWHHSRDRSAVCRLCLSSGGSGQTVGQPRLQASEWLTSRSHAARRPPSAPCRPCLPGLGPGERYASLNLHGVSSIAYRLLSSCHSGGRSLATWAWLYVAAREGIVRPHHSRPSQSIRIAYQGGTVQPCSLLEMSAELTQHGCFVGHLPRESDIHPADMAIDRQFTIESALH